MNIRNFGSFFSEKIAERGRECYAKKKVLSVEKDHNGYHARVEGSQNESYEVTVYIENDGEVAHLDCDCPFADEEEYCEHEFAVLCRIRDMVCDKKKQIAGMGEKISSVVERYAEQNRFPVHLYPKLRYFYSTVYMELYIGTDSVTYKVRDISELCRAFQANLHKDYGKSLSFVHSYNTLDKRSRELITIAEQAIYHIYESKSEVILRPHIFEHLLNLYADCGIEINGALYTIKDENPPMHICLTHEDASTVADIDFSCSFMGIASRAYYIDTVSHIIYRASLDFYYTITPITACKDTAQDLRRISDADLPAFYHTVIDRIENYADIETKGDMPDISVPTLHGELYVDAPRKNLLTASLYMCYGQKKYSCGYNSAENPFYDEHENEIYDTVAEYFDCDESEDEYQFVIKSASRIYEFLSHGAQELEQTVQVFLSDRLKSIRLRMPPMPKVTFAKENDILELDIDPGDYSLRELSDMLSAYEAGERYYLFDDGAIAPIDTLESFSEMLRALDLQDIDVLRANIKLPLFRMFYLDKLREMQETGKPAHSEKFRLLTDGKSLEELRKTYPCDEKLWNIMRSYQKEGFLWMSTLSGYGFGGILADDMGLGKTLQSIALISAITKKTGKTALVVCPASLVLNWQSELYKFAPDIKVACITGNIAVRNEFIRRIEEYDVAVTSYSALARDIDRYEGRHFSLCIADEAQTIKNQNAQVTRTLKAIESDIRFALTGTPIENTLSELWSIFDFIMPGFLHGYEHFKNTFEMPIVKQNDEKAINSLQMMVSPFILRRMKKDVLTELPEKTVLPLCSDMEKEQRKLYAACVAEAKQAISTTTDKITIFATLTRLRQICCDPTLAFPNYEGGSAKLSQCTELVQSCVESGHKILIFSQFTKMLGKIADELTKIGVTYYMLTGETSQIERMRLVTSFNTDDTNVFLISLRAGGTGLNLTGADIVIHYDPWWNISLENQASDRAYRMGQKRNVQVFKLIAKSSLEERIQKMQEHKAHLLDIAVGGSGNIGNMTTEEILELLE